MLYPKGVEGMPKGERRSRKEILSAQITEKQEKIAVFSEKIQQLESDITALQSEVEAITEAEIKAKQDAHDRELLNILKQHDMTKDRLLDLLQQSWIRIVPRWDYSQRGMFFCVIFVEIIWFMGENSL